MDAVTEDYYYSSYGPEEEPCDLDPDPAQVMAQTYLHSIICAFGLVGNALVVATYVFYKKTKTLTDIYLFNVAVTDLIFVAVLPFTIYNEQRDWPMGRVACKVLRSAYSVNLYSGMLLLACISGDRYVAIVWARRSFGARSRSLAYSRLVCSAVWVCAVALTLPTLIYSERLEERGPGAEDASVTCQMSFRDDATARLMKLLVPSLQMAVGFLLPLAVMVLCYSSVMCTLLRAQSSQRHKAIRVILAVVVVFIVCHLPYNVTLLSRTLALFKQRSCKMEKVRLRVLAISKSVAYLHCCLNPILYAFIGVKFRSHFLQIIKDMWCFGKKQVISARSTPGTSEIFKSSDGSNNKSSFSA